MKSKIAMNIPKPSLNFKDYLITSAPPHIYYVPNFISTEEETELLNRVDSSPKPKWTTLSNRRLQNWGGLPHPKGMVAERIPGWLEAYCDRISALEVFDQGRLKANHVLINEYLSGQGILPHEDGPLYYPTVTTISLGSHCMLDLYLKAENHGDSKIDDQFVSSVLVEPRSLLILQDSAYTGHLHGIKETCSDDLDEKVCNLQSTAFNNSLHLDPSNTSSDSIVRLQRGRRISLTIRHVPKVLKAKLIFGKK